MNKAKIAAAAASLGVLAIGWQVGTQAADLEAAPSTSATATGPGTVPTVAVPTTAASAAPTTTARTSATPPATAARPTSAATGAATGAATTGLKDGTFTGTTETHRFGSVTVTITVAGGKITEVTGATEAHDGKSQQINSRSVPQLRTEVLAAQSASVRTVSGATYTSEAYLTSLQAALDQAK